MSKMKDLWAEQNGAYVSFDEIVLPKINKDKEDRKDASRNKR